jgi:molybdate transport system substrate-binding protein
MRRAITALALLLCGCGGGAGAVGGGTADTLSGTVTVFAATSLTDAFTKVGKGYQAIHPRVMVRFTFAGTPILVTQLANGAQADVFASADEPNMDRVTGAGLAAGPPDVFAHNRLEIVVEPGNPKHITGLADLARPGLVVVLAGPTVPAGRYAGQALKAAGVTVTPASQETDVGFVVSKVALGEADAGIVYLTDVRAAGGRVSGVEIPDAYNVLATYPAVVLRGTANVPAAKAFVGYLLSAGQATLLSFGFTAP